MSRKRALDAMFLKPVERIAGMAEAVETPIGNLPAPGAIDIGGIIEYKIFRNGNFITFHLLSRCDKVPFSYFRQLLNHK